MSKLREINVLIIEDHALTRFGLKKAFDSVDRIKLISEAQDGESGVELTKKLKPDVVLMDLGLPGINGIEAIRQIKKFDNRIKIIVLTSHNTENEVWASIDAGANAYCLKNIEPERLIQVIESVYDGAAWIDPAIADMVLKGLADGNIRTAPLQEISPQFEEKLQLTRRESQVLRLIIDGCSNAEIAEKLFVSIHTVKAHVCNILQKLSVDDRTQAAIKALKEGLI